MDVFRAVIFCGSVAYVDQDSAFWAFGGIYGLGGVVLRLCDQPGGGLGEHSANGGYGSGVGTGICLAGRCS